MMKLHSSIRRSITDLIVLVLFMYLASCGPTASNISSPDIGNLTNRQVFTEGLAYESLGNYSKAVKRYNIIIEMKEKNTTLKKKAYLRLARLRKDDLSDPEKAITFYQKYLEIANSNQDEQYDNVLLELGLLYQNEEKFNRALETYKRLSDISDSDSILEQAYYNLGEVYSTLEKYDKSIETYKTLLDKFPEGSLIDGAIFQIGKIQESRNNNESALEWYERFLENHKNSDLREYIMYRTIRLGDKMNWNDVVGEWANTYAEEFEDGQYISEVNNYLEEDNTKSE